MTASRRNTRGAAPRDESPDQRPSKSQLKREAHALQQLGEKLTALLDDVLVRLPIGEDLIEAVRMARQLA